MLASRNFFLNLALCSALSLLTSACGGTDLGIKDAFVGKPMPTPDLPDRPGCEPTSPLKALFGSGLVICGRLLSRQSSLQSRELLVREGHDHKLSLLLFAKQPVEAGKRWMQGFQRIRHDLEGMIQCCDFLAQVSSDVLRTFGVERFRRCSDGASHLFQLASLLTIKLNRLPHEVQRRF